MVSPSLLQSAGSCLLFPCGLLHHFEIDCFSLQKRETHMCPHACAITCSGHTQNRVLGFLNINHCSKNLGGAPSISRVLMGEAEFLVLQRAGQHLALAAWPGGAVHKRVRAVHMVLAVPIYL